MSTISYQTSLHAVSHLEGAAKRQDYCGPAAISIITGHTAEEAAAWINAQRNRPVHYDVLGCFTYEIAEALERFGYMSFSYRFGSKERPRLKDWLLSRTPDQYRRVALVSVSRHFIVVQGNMFADSQNPIPVTLAHRSLLAKVKEVRWIYLSKDDYHAGLRRRRTPILPDLIKVKHLTTDIRQVTHSNGKHLSRYHWENLYKKRSRGRAFDLTELL